MATDAHIRDLSLGQELGDGGQGKVYELASDSALVLKTYHNQVTTQFDPNALSGLIDLADRLSFNGRAVTEWAAWPQARVSDGSRVIGFLMPRVPDQFLIYVGGRARLASLSYLATTPKPMWGPVVLPAREGRMAILAQLAGVMHVLHTEGLVVGDLSFGNVLWSQEPPGVMLIDCDGIHPEGGASAMPQADTIDWVDPRAQTKVPDRDRDRYKLSLAILRVLSKDLSATPDQSARLALDVPPEREGAIRDLLSRSAGAVGTRPEAREWRAALSSRATVAVTPPTPRPTTTLAPRPELLNGRRTSREYRPVNPPNQG